MKTLIVDDDPDLRLLVRVTLAADPRLEVIAEAATATDAIEMVMQTKPELIILDHLIDGKYTGLEAAPLLKAASPSSKIILFHRFSITSATRSVQMPPTPFWSRPIWISSWLWPSSCSVSNRSTNR